jgi:hypothetical protein
MKTNFDLSEEDLDILKNCFDKQIEGAKDAYGRHWVAPEYIELQNRLTMYMAKRDDETK